MQPRRENPPARDALPTRRFAAHPLLARSLELALRHVPVAWARNGAQFVTASDSPG